MERYIAYLKPVLCWYTQHFWNNIGIKVFFFFKF